MSQGGPTTSEARELQGTAASNSLSEARRAWVESLSIVLSHWKLVVSVTVACVVLTAVYAFVFMPNWYQATSTVLPARKSGGLLDNLAGGLSSTIKDLGITKIGGAGSSSDGFYNPITLLDSRELREKLILKHDLMKVYNAKSMADALKEFGEHVLGDVNEQGSISISFEDTSATRAAEITNELVEGINDINSRLATEEAKENFVFVEQRYKKNIEDLDTAEAQLGAFQERYGVFALPEQAKAELGEIAGLEQQKSQIEIQLHTAEKVYGPQSTEAELLRQTLTDLTQKSSALNTGADSKAPSYFVPTQLLPALALKYLRLMREVEIQSKLKAFLLPTYEQSKLDQTKRTLAFVTLDHAVTPTEKSRPHRAILLAVVLLSSVVITSICLILFSNSQRFLQRFEADRKIIEAEA